MVGSNDAARFRIVRTEASHEGFQTLVAELDKDLAIRDGSDHAFFAQFNTTTHLAHVVVVMDGDEPVGCGAFKPFEDDAVEIKRMYASPSHRRQGIGSMVLAELERWAAQLGHRRCVLETGEKQPEAIALYGRRGYHVMPNYGPYVGVESSRCFMKQLSSGPSSDHSRGTGHR